LFNSVYFINRLELTPKHWVAKTVWQQIAGQRAHDSKNTGEQKTVETITRNDQFLTADANDKQRLQLACSCSPLTRYTAQLFRETKTSTREGRVGLSHQL